METDSDFSDLSDDYTPQTAKKTPQKDAYRIKKALKPPITGTYAAESIYRWIDQGRVDLEPTYQREVVWQDAKQIKLIDSLLRNFYVPPVIFHKIQDEDGNEKRVCIDGKQRLTSIQKFMEGIIPHIDTETKKKYYFKAGRKGRPLLPEGIRNNFKEKQIVCIEYEGLSNAQEREIFQRVQLGMPLKPAERMAAIAGPWAAFVLELKEKYLDDGVTGFLSHINLTNNRGSGFLGIAQIVYGLDFSPKRASFGSGDVEKWLNRTDAPSKDFKTYIYAVFEKYLEVTALWDKPHVSPVEFVMMGVMVGRLYEDAANVIDQYIQNFRKSMKAKHVDLRLNSKVLKSAYDLIEKLPGKRGMKRGKDDLDEDAAEYRGSPVAKKTKAVTTRQQAASTSSPQGSPSKAKSTIAVRQASSSNAPSQRLSKSLSAEQGSSRLVSPLKAPNQSGPSSAGNLPTQIDVKPTLDTLEYLQRYKERKQSSGNQGSAVPTPGASTPRPSTTVQEVGGSRPAPTVATQAASGSHANSYHGTPSGSGSGSGNPGFASHLAGFFAASQPSLQGQSVQPQPYGFVQMVPPQGQGGMHQQQSQPQQQPVNSPQFQTQPQQW
ncbi:hypothetical protein FRB95_005214 [Tulasnella sp. JGI-2019a]|nr:hypothetical protein FRB93_000471 [Tulasnella sp. JGI-2019a]KAG9029540.1 hypothetical protein FRB95_005214 [Tulasnella sp. JGI-2019a]